MGETLTPQEPAVIWPLASVSLGILVTLLEFFPQIFPSRTMFSRRTVNFTTGKTVAEIGTRSNHLMESTF